jgi:predicted adenine nucleotide alpha hydrolase (AANH) superfamily ATPase
MKLLLHLCCANCAIFPLQLLQGQGIRPDGFFFNPNIHPYIEYRRRLETVQQFAALTDLTIHLNDAYLLEDFLAAVASHPEQRCNYCYYSRLEETARRASAMGYEAFSTTLLYSRYQQHEQIKSVGQQLAATYGLQFFYDDFRRGWQEGIRISKEMELYRQQYCGCIYSEKDRYHPRLKG